MSHIETLEYYNINAVNFVHGTVDVDFQEIRERFLVHIPPQGRILDFGCSSGKDAKYFHDRGFDVDAVDGSDELCKLACASNLHLSSSELRDVFLKMITALKNAGVIYTSFKYGEYEGIRNGRI